MRSAKSGSGREVFIFSLLKNEKSLSDPLPNQRAEGRFDFSHVFAAGHLLGLGQRTPDRAALAEAADALAGAVNRSAVAAGFHFIVIISHRQCSLLIAKI